MAAWCPKAIRTKSSPAVRRALPRIPIHGVNSLDADKYDAVHSGYDTALANQDPNRLVPLDTMRDLEREGVIGKLHEFVHSTGGAHAAVENATHIGQRHRRAV